MDVFANYYALITKYRKNNRYPLAFHRKIMYIKKVDSYAIKGGVRLYGCTHFKDYITIISLFLVEAVLDTGMFFLKAGPPDIFGSVR